MLDKLDFEINYGKVSGEVNETSFEYVGFDENQYVDNYKSANNNCKLSLKSKPPQKINFIETFLNITH